MRHPICSFLTIVFCAFELSPFAFVLLSEGDSGTDQEDHTDEAHMIGNFTAIQQSRLDDMASPSDRTSGKIITTVLVHI